MSEIIYENANGRIINGDNLEVMSEFDDNSVDTCISDFPYDLSFMSKEWDTTGNFYSWCYDRATALIRVLKPGGYAAIFGYPTTNHRMKCAFEDAGFKIVEEIDWIYGTGMPKSQSIKGLAEKSDLYDIATSFDGYNTNGLKPAHEPITIFQKPLDGTYIQNLEKWNVGAMNIEACRVPFTSDADKEERAAKCNFTSASDGTRGYATADTLYGSGISPLEQARQLQNVSGRFPPNMIFDEITAKDVDEQSGISIYGDVGGASRYFPIIKYNAKASNEERTLPDGSRNPHVTIKPIELIKWLVKLLTPKGGYTIDITAGSCTHAVACEELNRDSNYGLKWCNIELMNTDKDPYCSVGKMRVENVIKNSKKKLF